MEQFSLEKYLQNPNKKLITEDGKQVRIICIDAKGIYSVIGLISKTGYEKECAYNVHGVPVDNRSNTLFFADEDEKLTEFEEQLASILFDREYEGKTNTEDDIERSMVPYRLAAKEYSRELLDLARKELEKENSEFKPKFTYDEKDYSKLGNKLIEFRNNTPLCSVSYREGEGRKIILHYEKEIFELVKNEILEDLPKWKRSNSFFNTGNKFELGKTSLRRFDGYEIPYSELEKLPKEE